MSWKTRSYARPVPPTSPGSLSSQFPHAPSHTYLSPHTLKHTQHSHLSPHELFLTHTHFTPWILSHTHNTSKTHPFSCSLSSSSLWSEMTIFLTIKKILFKKQDVAPRVLQLPQEITTPTLKTTVLRDTCPPRAYKSAQSVFSTKAEHHTETDQAIYLYIGRAIKEESVILQRKICKGEIWNLGITALWGIPIIFHPAAAFLRYSANI